MIEVRCDQTGDWAEAESPEAAVVAARTLCEDAWEALPMQGSKRTTTFTVDGRIIAAAIPEHALWRVALTPREEAPDA